MKIHGLTPNSHGRVFLLYFLGLIGLTEATLNHSLLPTTNVISTPQHPYLQHSLRKEFVKAQILQRLGLSQKPVVDLSHKISRDLVLETLRRAEGLDLENTVSIVGAEPANVTRAQTESYGGRHYAKTAEIISFPDKGPMLNDQTLLSFSFAGNNAFGVGVRVRKAHLWIKVNYESTLGREFGHVLYPKGITLYVFTVQGNFSSTNTRPSQPVLRPQDVSLDLVISKTIPIDSLGWQKLDVTSVVQKWYTKLSRHRIRHPHSHAHSRGNSKLTLLIDCSGCGASVRPILFQNMDSRFDSSEEPELESSVETSADTMTELPFLILETETGKKMRRNRRIALDCSSRVRRCCKQRFFVSFQDLGWGDWIIAPRGYYANYCRGHCGGIHRTPDTFLNYHTHVMEEYRRTPAGQMELRGLTPCCSPTKFSSLSLIYFGPDLNIIKRDLPKMIVEECGCP